MDVILLHASCQPSNRVSMSAEFQVLASVARAEQRAALVAAGAVPRARRGRRGGRSQQVQPIRIDPVGSLYLRHRGAAAAVAVAAVALVALWHRSQQTPGLHYPVRLRY